MEKRRRYALIGVIAAVLLAIAVVITWQVAQHRAEQAFIAEQYAKLEEDKAALEEETPTLLSDREAGLLCQDEWEKDDDVRRFWEIDSVTTGALQQVTDEGLYTVSGHASGTDGQKPIESNFSCSVRLDGDEWLVELL